MVSANVSDEITEKSLDQVQRENEAKLLERKVSDDTKAFSPGDDYSLDNNAVEMFDLPNNTPKINMEGIPKINLKFVKRMMSRDIMSWFWILLLLLVF